jgi:amino acid efflux transporter
VTVLYVGLAIASIGVPIGHSAVPLAKLMAAGLGEDGRRATSVLAIALTLATMNVYLGSAARLAASLAKDGSLPVWIGAGPARDVPRRPLVVIALWGALTLSLIASGVLGYEPLVHGMSACFIAVYVAATAAATRLLAGATRWCALAALISVGVVSFFSGAFLALPAICATLVWAERARLKHGNRG